MSTTTVRKERRPVSRPTCDAGTDPVWKLAKSVVLDRYRLGNGSNR
jgi:hypothetical protein